MCIDSNVFAGIEKLPEVLLVDCHASVDLKLEELVRQRPACGKFSNNVKQDACKNSRRNRGRVKF